MDLKNAINNTNVQKENVKQAKQLINGILNQFEENANTINEVPQKINYILDKVLKYKAQGTFNQNCIISASATGGANTPMGKKQIFTIPINLQFNPKKIILHFAEIRNPDGSYIGNDQYTYNATLDSDKQYGHDNALLLEKKSSTLMKDEKNGDMVGKYTDTIWIESFDKDNIKFGACLGMNPNVSCNFYIYSPIEWIALG